MFVAEPVGCCCENLIKTEIIKKRTTPLMQNPNIIRKTERNKTETPH